jgi:NAD(P)-dependent dehydrogenase (short-subunit alcohol dehydrogenase family)
MAKSMKYWWAWAAAGAAGWLVFRTVLRRQRCYDFAGRTVLITGGSRGLGLLLARRLVDEGAWVAVCARDETELARAHDDLARRGGQVLTVRCDVANQHQVEAMVGKVRAKWGPIDVLINNAGVIEVGPMEEMTLEDYQRAMQIHYWGPLFTTLAVLPGMRRQGQGRIVNIASIGGKISVPHLLPYSASKFALVGLSEGLRAELLKDGIYVTTVCPGLMRTGSPSNADFKGQHEWEFAWFCTSGSLPLVSMDADRAARQIVEACRYGQAELILSLPAKAATLLHDLAPGAVTDALALGNRLLPGPGGIGTQRAKGRDSRPPWLPPWLTALTDRAAEQYNELEPPAASTALPPSSDS